MNTFDVRIHAIRRRRNRRRPFEVRWHAAGRARSRSFVTRALADSYRAELVRAARRSLEFGPGTGEAGCWAARPAAALPADARGDHDVPQGIRSRAHVPSRYECIEGAYERPMIAPSLD